MTQFEQAKSFKKNICKKLSNIFRVFAAVFGGILESTPNRFVLFGQYSGVALSLSFEKERKVKNFPFLKERKGKSKNFLLCFSCCKRECYIFYAVS
jgi:hypothetical protein